MNFLNLPGLWLLLGIPALIIIYLIKAQHEDRPVSSTYIWKLSSRFMKKRLPLQKIKKFLSFLLQLLIVAGVALLASRPAVTDGKSCDYIAIIDASASMQTADDTGATRFELALEQMEDLSEEVTRGHRLSVIVAGEDASWLIQESTSQNEVKLALNNVQCTYGGCNIAEALELAQEMAQSCPNPQVLFFTDNDYTETNGVQVVNLSRSEWNVSVSGVTAAPANRGTVFTGTLISSNREAAVSVGLRIDGSIVDAQVVQCAPDVPTTVTFTADSVSAYDTAEIFVETQDGLTADNSYAICRQNTRTYRVLLCSGSPLYLESALNALGSCQVTVSATAEEADLSGYDLYIFDGVYPEEYPTDGSVLQFGARQLPDGLAAGTAAQESAPLTMDAKQQSDLYQGLSLLDTAVTNYAPLRGNGFWKSLFFCGDSAVISSRDLGNGLRFTVASFDLHDSNLPMLTDFVLFMRNLVEYSVPDLLKDTDHIAGSTVTLTVMSGAQELYVELPDGSVKALSTAADTCAVTAREVGIYTAVMTTADGGEYVDFFVHIPDGESVSRTLAELSVELTPSADQPVEDAIAEIWFWVAVAMLIIVLAEWGWYYHEQY